MTHVSIKNLTKVYPGLTVPSLDNLSLEINSGSLTALLGPSGCGKTTTMKMIAGLLDQTSGDVTFDGTSILKEKPENRGVVMVFQNHLLFPYMNVQDNIGFGLKMRNVHKDEIFNRVIKMLDLVKLPNMENRMPKELSGGQQQRVALARALIVQPRVLLLDEPLSNLDAHLRFEMRDLIRNLQQSMGITTIFVTHDQEEAVVLADQVALILDGKLKQYAQPDVFYKKPIDVVTAKFFGGQNFIKGTSKNNNFSSNIGKLALPKDCLQGNGILTFRPENVQIGKGPKSVNTIKAKIIEKIFLGTQTRLKLSIKDEVIQAIANPNEVDEKETGIEIDINIPPSCLWVINN
ncbi:MAG: ABC transporter ATP-binding protein [Alphaproteobacteria bacterium]|jgi:ABC-type Fe3+/spermidine/putrescine transport system ATPase subunit|nr:MAG: ABC transporter ATP-binding protein [Alphaproteobacteria bacterium]|tara:strand:+ start:3213 stop:4256 length:1044 start_codon:yes stop_codon:yes gene_type:complete